MERLTPLFFHAQIWEVDMANCSVCGKELPQIWSTDKCLDCSREAVRKIFKENPEVKQAFRESIEEMQKPEHMKVMVDNTCKFMGAIQKMQKSRK